MTSQINLKCAIEYQQLNDLLRERVKDIQVNEQVMLHQVSMDGEGEELIILARLSGVYDGDVRVQCKPKWDQQATRLDLGDVELKIMSKNIFAKSANWMANQVLGKTIDKKFAEILNQQIHSFIQGWFKKLERFELPDGFVFELSEPVIDVTDIHSKNGRLYCQLHFEGGTVVYLGENPAFTERITFSESDT